jgi:hypothetical protein
MKRILLAFLVLAVVAVGAVTVSALPEIDQDATVTPTSRVWAAWQPFENGVMMWWSDLDGGQIWVLINPVGNTPGQAYIYEDDWTGESLSSITPPAGRFTPVRGFGRVWRLLGGASSGNQLGWALSEEIGFDSASRTFSGNTIIVGGPGDTEYTVSFLPTAQSNIFYGVGTFSVIDFG